MKKKKILKTASLVALSAVMMSGAAVAFAGCENADLTLRVSIFANAQDGELTKRLCNEWAADYTKKLREEGTLTEEEEVGVDFSYQTNNENYFTNLLNEVASNTAPDIFYVSPKYVKAWKKLGRVLDLSEYLADSSAQVANVWDDSIGFYGYAKNSADESRYTQGERISYDASTKTFKTANGVEAGIYGLPKDYSNFGLGFNNRYFSPEMRERYQTSYATDSRNVTGAEYAGKNITYQGGSGENGTITYAVTGVVDGKPIREGDNAPIINPGIPTTYKPYNFYQFPSYQAALAGGDPMALSVDAYTNGKGYTVTIPGYPGDTFADTFSTEAYKTMPADKQAEGVEYDATQGYITFTYQEYGALTWAVTYYLNTFAWDTSDGATNVGGGIDAGNSRKNIYGNDQYDGGSTLYLLPWLASNDANYLNTASTLIKNPTGTDSEKVTKMTVDGKGREADVQYGANSERFIETLGAFHAYGSDWNGNSNNASDTSAAKSSGWDYFCAGTVIFYGAGTWDAVTRNEADITALEFRSMPEPVAEKYALYSTVKDADYNMKEYGTKPTGIYTEKEIYDNQVERQDKWAARMDSVGFGVNSALKQETGKAAWKAQGAVELVKLMTINEDTQVTLTYSGSQLPNFKTQCVEFLHYQDEQYATTGSFKNMITPDGSATVSGDAGRKIWNDTYQIARNMKAASNDPDWKNKTVSEWMAANAANVNYDKSFDSDKMSTVDDLAYAMKILYLVTYTKADRDIALRMQIGLNAVRDSGMYTYETKWLGAMEPRGKNYMMAYINKAAGKYNQTDLRNIIKSGSTSTPTGQTALATPKWFCEYFVNDAQKLLDESLTNENIAMGNR